MSINRFFALFLGVSCSLMIAHAADDGRTGGKLVPGQPDRGFELAERLLSQQREARTAKERKAEVEALLVRHRYERVEEVERVETDRVILAVLKNKRETGVDLFTLHSLLPTRSNLTIESSPAQFAAGGEDALRSRLPVWHGGSEVHTWIDPIPAGSIVPFRPIVSSEPLEAAGPKPPGASASGEGTVQEKQVPGVEDVPKTPNR